MTHRLSNNPIRATLIVNPRAGKSAEGSIKRAFNLFVDRGVDAEILFTNHRGHAEAIARTIALESLKAPEQQKAGQRFVVAVGGDGTYNEVANGLVNSPIPMGILPLGTTSVLARELMIPKDIEGAVKTILEGEVIDANLGFIDCMNNGNPVSRYFLLMAGVGFDGETVRLVDVDKKRLFGKLAYIISGIRYFALLRDAFIRARILGGNFLEGLPDSADNDGSVLECTNLIVGKGRYYGGSFTVTKDANIRDSSFYCFATKGKGRINLMKYLVGILFNRHRGLSDTRYFETSNIYLEGDAEIQIDGDYIGRLPAHLQTKTQCLRLIVNRLLRQPNN